MTIGISSAMPRELRLKIPANLSTVISQLPVDNKIEEVTTEYIEEATTEDAEVEVERPAKSHRISGDSKQWYLNQFNSGRYQYRNCGPAVIAMAINWANDSNNITVEEIRNSSNIKNDFRTNEVRNIIEEDGIEVRQEDYKTDQDLINKLLEDKLIILCIKGGIVNTSNGHYVIVHGYKYYDDKLYFIINDPWTRSDREVSAKIIHEEIMEWFDAVIVVSQIETPILLH